MYGRGYRGSVYMALAYYFMNFPYKKERHKLRGDHVMDTLVNILASAVSSLTNPTKLADTFKSKGIQCRCWRCGTFRT